MQGLATHLSAPISLGDSDALLVLAAQRDPTQFAALYRRHVVSVYRYLLSKVGHVGDAEDLTAEVFSDALRNLPRYRENGRFTAWLFRIARNKAADHFRQTRLHIPLEAATESLFTHEDPQQQIEQMETGEKLDQMLAELDEHQRELLRLRFAGGLSYGEIGQITGKSEAATKMAIRRLLQHMAQEWEERS